MKVNDYIESVKVITMKVITFIVISPSKTADESSQ